LKDIPIIKNFTQSSKVKKKNDSKQDIPVTFVGDGIFQTNDKKYKVLAKVSPVNAEIMDEDELYEIAEAIASALSTFEGRQAIYIQSQKIDIEENIRNIELEKLSQNSELKIEVLEEQKRYLEAKVSKSTNVFNFYVVLETDVSKYQVAEQILDDAIASFKSELENVDLTCDKLSKEEQLRLFYERLNPESSVQEPFQDEWALDDIKPEKFVRYKDGRHIEVDGYKHRFFSINRFPKKVDQFRWLSKVFKAKGNVNVAITLNPKDKTKVNKQLSNAYTEYKNKEQDARDKSEQLEHRNKKDSAERMLESIGSDNTHLYDVNITIGVAHEDKDELETLVRTVRNKISAARCRSIELTHKDLDPYWTCFPILSNNRITQNFTWNFTNDDIAALIPFDSSELMEEKGIVIGDNVTSNSLGIVDYYNKDLYNNPHMAVLADTGSGKSIFLQCDSIRIFPYVDYVINFDVEGEYFFPWASRYVFSSTSDVVTNPFHIRNAIVDTDGHDDGKVDIGVFLSRKVSEAKSFFKKIDPTLSPFDLALLDKDIRDTYKEENIDENTKELPGVFPTLSTFDEVMTKKIKDPNESERSKEARINMQSVFEPYIYGSYSRMFNGQTNWDFKPHTVFDISLLAKDVRKPLYEVLLQDTWQFCKFDRTKRKSVYVDEAHEFADEKSPETLEFLSTIVKRGRKYGVRLVTATQNLPDFLSIERHGQAIIDNSNFKIFFKLGESDHEEVQKLYSFSVKEMKLIKGGKNKRKGTKGRGIFMAGAQRVEFQSVPSEYEWEIVDPETYETLYKKKSRYRKGS